MSQTESDNLSFFEILTDDVLLHMIISYFDNEVIFALFNASPILRQKIVTNRRYLSKRFDMETERWWTHLGFYIDLELGNVPQTDPEQKSRDIHRIKDMRRSVSVKPNVEGTMYVNKDEEFDASIETIFDILQQHQNSYYVAVTQRPRSYLLDNLVNILRRGVNLTDAVFAACSPDGSVRIHFQVTRKDSYHDIDDFIDLVGHFSKHYTFSGAITLKQLKIIYDEFVQLACTFYQASVYEFYGRIALDLWCGLRNVKYQLWNDEP